MQNLSLAAQAQALSAALVRQQIERRQAADYQARLTAERHQRMENARQVKAGKRTEPTAAERILAVMQPNRAYAWAELRTLAGVSSASYGKAMTDLIHRAAVEKTLEPGNRPTLYSLP